MPETQLSRALFADLYELTMAQAFWQNGMNGSSTFSLFIRHYPPDRGYFVFGGLSDVLDYLESFHFTGQDIAALRLTEKFDNGFLDYLASLRFSGTVRAMREGSIFFANEPVIEVSGPLIEAQIIETYLVNQVNVQTTLATKASRVIHAAKGRLVVDFSARRTHGIDAANSFARLSYMVGFAGTSNVLAGGMFGIPTFGTIAHSFVTAFENETESFRAYARSFPDSSTFLVDTYDTLEGTRHAIQVAGEMKRAGHSLQAIRLDSGDLLDLSIKTRIMLDEAGLSDVQVFGSGGLDEFEMDRLVNQGARIDGFGVGTKAGVSADAPWTDCVYKLVDYKGRPVLKLSAGKQTLPGPKQVYRIYGDDGHYQRDTIGLLDETASTTDGEPLLKVVMESGKRCCASPSLEKLRDAFRRELSRLPASYKSLKNPDEYPVEIGENLLDIQAEVVRAIHANET